MGRGINGSLGIRGNLGINGNIKNINGSDSVGRGISNNKNIMCII